MGEIFIFTADVSVALVNHSITYAADYDTDYDTDC